jgi:hypothetical protein
MVAGCGIGRGHANEAAEYLANRPEVQRWIEVLNQVEYVALPVGKLVQVEVAAEVQLEEGRSRVRKDDVPGLGSDAGEGLGGQLHVRDDLGPVRDRGPNDRLLSVGVQLVLLEVQARSNHDAGDLPRGEVDGAQPVAGAPVVVGRVVARRDLGGSSVYDRPVTKTRRRTDQSLGPRRSASTGAGLSRRWIR